MRDKRTGAGRWRGRRLRRELGSGSALLATRSLVRRSPWRAAGAKSVAHAWSWEQERKSRVRGERGNSDQRFHRGRGHNQSGSTMFKLNFVWFRTLLRVAMASDVPGLSLRETGKRDEQGASCTKAIDARSRKTSNPVHRPANVPTSIPASQLYRTFQTCALSADSPLLPLTVQVISTMSSREFSGFLLHVNDPRTTDPAPTHQSIVRTEREEGREETDLVQRPKAP